MPILDFAADKIAKALMRPAAKAGGPWSPQEYGSFMGITGDPLDAEVVGDDVRSMMQAPANDAWVYSCVSKKANAVSRVPLKLWRLRKGDKDPVEIERHPILTLMEEVNPFPDMWGPDLTKFEMLSCELTGASWSTFALNQLGQPNMMIWRTPGEIKPVPDADTFVSGFKMRQNSGEEKNLPTELVLWMRYPNPGNRWEGLAPLAAARQGVNLGYGARQQSLVMRRNRNVPSYILESDGPVVTQQEQARVRRWIRQWLGGKNAGSPLVLGGGLHAKTLSLSPRDSAYIEEQRLTRWEICAVFGVPLPIAGDLERATYSNYDQAQESFWQDTLIPWLDWRARQYTRQLVRRFFDKDGSMGLYLAHDYTAIEALTENAGDVYDRAMKASAEARQLANEGVLTRNQARLVEAQIWATIGIDPAAFDGDLPGGDRVFVNYLMIGDDEAGKDTLIEIFEAKSGATDPTDVADPNDPEAPEPEPKEEPPPAPKPPKGRIRYNHVAVCRACGYERRHQRASVARADAEGHALALGHDCAAKSQIQSKAADPVREKERRLAPVRESFERDLKRYFGDLQREALSRYREDGKARKDPPPPPAMLVPDDWWDESTAAAALRVLEVRYTDEAQEQAWDSVAADGFAVSWNVEDNKVAATRDRLAREITRVNDTTKDSIADAVSSTLAQGGTLQDVRDAIVGVFKQASGYRSELIARTETGTAYNHATLDAYGEAGVVFVEIHDGDTPTSDEECTSRNGDVVTLDEAYELTQGEHPNGTLGFSAVSNEQPDDQSDQD